MTEMRVFVAIGWAFALAVPAAASAGPNSTGARTSTAPVRVEMTEEGAVFATASGMTLYTYSGDDGTPGKSQCLSVPRTDHPDPTAGFGRYPVPMANAHKACVQKWPPFMADANASAGGDWSFISRPEGKQWTYQGRPLYTSIKDRKAGDINGAFNIGQLRGWRLAMAPVSLPPGLKLIRRAEGLVVATKNDRPVYTPAAGRRSSCERCEELFRPLAAPAIAKVTGDWSIVDAGTGQRQYAFKGQPLFAAPDSLSGSETAASGDWHTVVYRKSAGAPADVSTRLSVIGEVYADAAGKTLYVFTCSTPVGDGVRCDDPGESAVYWSALCGEAKDCATRWRPYIAAPGSRDHGQWTVVEVADPMFIDALGITYPPGTPRVKAWAFRGRPVYTYFKDKEPGDIWGHSLRWFAFSGFYALQVPGRGLLD